MTLEIVKQKYSEAVANHHQSQLLNQEIAYEVDTESISLFTHNVEINHEGRIGERIKSFHADTDMEILLRELVEHLVGHIFNPDLDWVKIGADPEVIEALPDPEGARKLLKLATSSFKHKLMESNFYAQVFSMIWFAVVYGMTCITNFYKEDEELVLFRTENPHRVIFTEDKFQRPEMIFWDVDMSYQTIEKDYPEAAAKIKESLGLGLMTKDQREAALGKLYEDVYTVVNACLWHKKEYYHWTFVHEPLVEISKEKFSFKNAHVGRLYRKRNPRGTGLGYSAALLARSLDHMKEDLMRGVEKALNPAMNLPDGDGFGDFSEDKADRVFYFSDPSMKPEVIKETIDIASARQIFQDEKESGGKLTKKFELQLESQKDRRSPTEADQAVALRNNRSAPILYRVLNEAIYPLLNSALDFYVKHNIIQSLNDPLVRGVATIKIKSPLTSSQDIHDLVNIGRALELINPLVTSDPSVMDYTNSKKLLAKVFDKAGLGDILNRFEEAEKKKKERMEKQNADSAKARSEAAVNEAQAGQIRRGEGQ